MRQLIVTAIATLDGFVAGPGGDVMVMPFDEGFDVYAAERMRAADHLLLGRTTYEEFRAYWPGIADDPAQAGAARGRAAAAGAVGGRRAGPGGAAPARGPAPARLLAGAAPLRRAVLTTCGGPALRAPSTWMASGGCRGR
ncbi:dihydrofolate reductase family protein [Actinomycetospora straminea]|uniref:RibD domain-containing protein n=1 Tax=Actinomycetospora straminea TaxID=663607 RepID=A0ABP9DVJ2_9PSEU|nr:hypothetical protein [Actinomycetospora straminea]MDD7935904.1 hypothetical protein [Actinomycetospora straminea]